jgi:hypothetical protein
MGSGSAAARRHGLAALASYFSRKVPAPEGEFRSVPNSELPEDVVDVFLHCADGETELVRDFLVALGLLNQVHDLAFAEGQRGGSRFFLDAHWVFAGGTGVLSTNCAEVPSTTGARLWSQYRGELLEYSCCHVRTNLQLGKNLLACTCADRVASGGKRQSVWINAVQGSSYPAIPRDILKEKDLWLCGGVPGSCEAEHYLRGCSFFLTRDGGEMVRSRTDGGAARMAAPLGYAALRTCGGVAVLLNLRL